VQRAQRLSKETRDAGGLPEHASARQARFVPVTSRTVEKFPFEVLYALDIWQLPFAGVVTVLRVRKSGGFILTLECQIHYPEYRIHPQWDCHGM
jgi:hypothetical protein